MSRRQSKSRSHRRRTQAPPAVPAYSHPLLAAMSDLLKPLLAQQQDPSRCWTNLKLCLCAILMAWDPSPTLVERFESAGRSLGSMLPKGKQGRTYQGFIKALRNGNDLHATLAAHLRAQMPQWCKGHWLREEHCAFAVDSSKFDCPRTAANERFFGTSGKNNSGPQMLLTSLWHMGSGLPWDWRITPLASGERKGLLQMLGDLPADALLVGDAGFTGYDLLKSILQSGRHLLIRVGSNVSLLCKLGLMVRECKDSVYLWPAGDRRRQTRRKRNRPLALRLIRLSDSAGRPVYLLSDLDRRQLPKPRASMLYRLRWGVEVFYRSLKRKLSAHKLRSAAPRQALLELHWAVLGCWVLGLLTVRRIIDAKHDPLCWSVAAALRAVRRAARDGERAADLEDQLEEAIKDNYRRKGSKAARHWPRKRPQRPPGEPNLRPATKAEIKLAGEYHDKIAA